MENNLPMPRKQEIIEEIKELMNEDKYYKDVYEVILELFNKGKEETAYKIYFLLNP
ncbi:hypothetical protein [Metallosphaera sedula]|uniref:hypothetical protein n=1 Tax=Metallosphaera sedula TaxID=43687 RepID=UPI0020C1353A|nr:hypothetical protein [Metallosphaera sedula]BBL47843.1 hypothetical protein MJ1HA_1953 [Metallosphaera sedula]